MSRDTSASSSNGSSGSLSSSSAFINDLLASSLPSQSVDGTKAALSLRTTTLQFTRFVQKTGPVFTVSDKIEAILRWQDPLQTLFVAGVWALVALYPQLVLLVPSVGMTALLLVNHNKRFPPAKLSLDNPYHEAADVKPPVSGQPPTEGSVDYLQNMQNIQELMGRVADLTDAGRSMVPYFNWSNPHTSSALLQLSSILTLVLSLSLYLSSPYLNMRYVFLVLGEALFAVCHPFSLSVYNSVSSSASAKLYVNRLKSVLLRFLADDALKDEVVYPTRKGEKRLIKDVIVLENERRSLDGTWSTEALKEKEGEMAWRVFIDGTEQSFPASSLASSTSSNDDGRSRALRLSSSNSSISSAVVADAESQRTLSSSISLPRGYIYLPGSLEEWSIDTLGDWNVPYRVDAEGWAFWDADDRPMAIDPEQKNGQRKGAARRERRWCRRIVSTPVY